MLTYLYWFTSLLVLVVIARKKRPVSPTSIFGLGTIVYGLPLYFGYTQLLAINASEPVSYFSLIDWKIYIIFLGCQVVFFIASLFKEKKLEPGRRPSSLFFFAMVITLLIYMILLVSALGFSGLFVTSKSELLEILPRWHSLCSILSVCCFIYYVIYGRKKDLIYLIIPTMFVILDLCMGFRITFFLGLISVILAYFGLKNNLGFPEKLYLSIGLVLILVSVFVYDSVYYIIKIGFFDRNYFFYSVFNSLSQNEPFVIMSVLNEVVKKGVKLPDLYFIQSILQYIPFFESLTEIKNVNFNTYSQGTFFPAVQSGLASTAFGELYAVGGFFMIFLFLGLIFIFLRMPLPRKNPLAIIFYYYITPHMVLYFHRNDWHKIIGTSYLFGIAFLGVLLLYWVSKIIIGKITVRKIKNKYANFEYNHKSLYWRR